ncbi:MAG: methyltransferase domain-containing protein [Candidatus Krumholzibacteria bacterium]|nr:methyltransferase domain-containing protein [Candidatus Krumholzibacteria bacterium]
MLDTAKEMDQVREYYGKIFKSNRDLKSSACCANGSLPPYQREIINLIDDEILQKFYGCGSPIPMAIEGAVVLDLGCGTGRDAFMSSRLVGPAGRVIGIDMTDEQLDVARRHIDRQMIRFGFLQPNVDFRKGYIEDLAGAGIDDESVDVVISNCVINLSPDKRSVFSEIFRVLKPGGELFFSDVFAGRRVPEDVRGDAQLYAECLGGAMYKEDFRRMLAEGGIADYRVVSASRITLEDPALSARAGMVDFYSMTIRAFKLRNLEDICEDYGHIAVYKGTISESPHDFVLDDHHRFIAGKPMLVCGNTAAMLEDTRYARHFQVTGDRTTHYGPFDCSPASDRISDDRGAGGACC